MEDSYLINGMYIQKVYIRLFPLIYVERSGNHLHRFWTFQLKQCPINELLFTHYSE